MLLQQGALQLKRRQHRAAGVIFVRQRRAKQGHEAITETLINGAFIAMYRIQSQSKEAVQQAMHGFRPQALGEGGGVGEVAKQHGDLLALAFEGTARGENLLDQVEWRVGHGATCGIQDWDGRWQGCWGRCGHRLALAHSHEYLALFSEGQALAVDKFLLQIFQIGIVKMKLAFEGPIGQAPTAS